jgi:hypothetical protein
MKDFPTHRIKHYNGAKLRNYFWKVFIVELCKRKMIAVELSVTRIFMSFIED